MLLKGFKDIGMIGEVEVYICMLVVYKLLMNSVCLCVVCFESLSSAGKKHDLKANINSELSNDIINCIYNTKRHFNTHINCMCQF